MSIGKYNVCVEVKDREYTYQNTFCGIEFPPLLDLKKKLQKFENTILETTDKSIKVKSSQNGQIYTFIQLSTFNPKYGKATFGNYNPVTEIYWNVKGVKCENCPMWKGYKPIPMNQLEVIGYQNLPMYPRGIGCDGCHYKSTTCPRTLLIVTFAYNEVLCISSYGDDLLTPTLSEQHCAKFE